MKKLTPVLERDGFLKIYSAQIDGKKFEYMDRGHSVSIVVQEKGSGNFVILEQMRIGPFIVEGTPISHSLVAGMIDSGESPMQSAVRELREELGVDPLKMISLGRSFCSPGGTTEVSHLFYAEIEDQDEYIPEDVTEGITTVTFSEAEALDKALNGEFNSMQLSYGLLRVHHYLENNE